MHSTILETTSSNFQLTIFASGVSGVFHFFLMHLLSFSLCAELLEASSRAGEGVPDSSWLIEFDVLELPNPLLLHYWMWWRHALQALSSYSGLTESYFAACFFRPFLIFLLLSALESSTWQLLIWSSVYLADLGGLRTDVYLVSLHRDVKIDQYLAVEMQLECRLGNSNSCIPSKDRHAAYWDTNFPPAPFDCSTNMK